MTTITQQQETQIEKGNRITKSELTWYLEDAYQMDLLDDIETDIYERYTYGSTITKSEWIYVAKGYKQLQNEVF